MRDVSIQPEEMNSSKIVNNIIPLETEYRMQFLITNLVFYELFCLVSPQDIIIDIGLLIATDAIYYAYFIPSGYSLLCYQEIQTFITRRVCWLHPWLKIAFDTFTDSIYGRSEADRQYIFYNKCHAPFNIDEMWRFAWVKVVLPEYKDDLTRMERLKQMWKYMLCMYKW